MNSIALVKNAVYSRLTPEGILQVPVDTVSLIAVAVNTAPPGGMDIIDMSYRLDIISATKRLQPEDTELFLDDTLFKKLKEYVAMTKWGIVDQRIIDFVNFFNPKK